MENRTIELYDVTPRDGDQAYGVDMSADDKIRLIRLSCEELGIPYAEAGYPLSNDQDRAVFQHFKNHPLTKGTYAAFGMTRKKEVSADKDEGMRALVESGAPSLTVVGKSSLYQAREVILATPEENIAMIRDSVAFLCSFRNDVTYDAEHFFDAFREDEDYAFKTLQAALEGGARRLVLCDTNGGSLPHAVGKAVSAVRRTFSDVMIGIHPHDDRNLAMANMIAAVEEGARHVQGTFNGIGERTGNLDLLAAIANLDLEGYKTLEPDALKKLTQASKEAALVTRQPRNAGQPFFGDRAYAHKGGMHASGMERTVGTSDTAAYEFMSPDRFGNQRIIVGSKQAGLSNVRTMLQHTKLLDTSRRDRILENKELQQRILNALKDHSFNPQLFHDAEASFDLFVLRTLEMFEPKFRRITDPKISGTLGGEWEAMIKLGVNGHDEVHHEIGEGQGSIEALTSAIRKALSAKFPRVKEVRIHDFHVRIPSKEHKGASSVVEVTVSFTDGTDIWTTIGVHRDMIDAGWMALNDGFEYKLLKDEYQALALAEEPDEDVTS